MHHIFLQGKLELITGATASLMKLQLFDDNDKPVCELCDDTSTLGSTSIKDGYRIHVCENWIVDNYFNIWSGLITPNKLIRAHSVEPFYYGHPWDRLVS